MCPSATRTFDARPDQLAEIDDFVAAFGSANALPEPVVFRARVCAAELAANVLEHGGARPEIDKMTVGVSADSASGTLSMTFTDTTAPFDPTRPEAISDLSAGDRVGGRGLKLVQNLSSSRSYRHDGAHNIVRLEFIDRDAAQKGS